MMHLRAHFAHAAAIRLVDELGLDEAMARLSEANHTDDDPVMIAVRRDVLAAIENEGTAASSARQTASPVKLASRS